MTAILCPPFERRVAWLWEKKQDSSDQERAQTAAEEAGNAPKTKRLCALLAGAGLCLAASTRDSIILIAVTMSPLTWAGT